MRKHLLHVLIITFVFFLTPTIQAASDLEEAVEAYKQVIRIDPDNAKAHNNLGNAYFSSGMYKEAIEAYKQTIRIDPDDAQAHVNLGLAYVFLNDRGSALEQYKILKSLDSELANKLYNMIYK
jgi:tetratricopeptide (TPR) repeat protein